MEEIDLCWRLQLAGYLCAAVPGQRCTTSVEAHFRAENPRKTYLNSRNNLLMLHKNLPKDVRRGILLRRRLLDTAAWARYILTLRLRQRRSNMAARTRLRRYAKKLRHQSSPKPARKRTGSDIDILSSYYIQAKTHLRHPLTDRAFTLILHILAYFNPK